MENLTELLQFAETESQKEKIEAYIKYGSSRKAAAALGVNKSNVSRAVQIVRKNAAKRGYAPDNDMTRICPEGYSVKGTSTLYDEDGNVKIQWVKTNQEKQDMLEMLDEFKEGLTDMKPAKKVKAPKKADSDYMACYVVGDHHFGMYSWGRETLDGEDWDTDKSREVLVNAIDRLVERAGDAETGLLLNVGDFFHSNDTKSETARGTKVDTDGRFGRTIRMAGELFAYLIERMLERHKKVIIVNARGNHDPDASLWLNEMLRMYYSKEPRVTVKDNFNKFVWMTFGNNLIVTHHGDHLKMQQAYEAITRNLSKEWGETTHRFLWMGHIHHKQQHEFGGILAESFNVLSPQDYWHSSSGYGSARSMTCILLHKEYGIDCRFQANIQALINHD